MLRWRLVWTDSPMSRRDDGQGVLMACVLAGALGAGEHSADLFSGGGDPGPRCIGEHHRVRRLVDTGGGAAVGPFSARRVGVSRTAVANRLARNAGVGDGSDQVVPRGEHVGVEGVVDRTRGPHCGVDAGGR